MGNKGNRYSRIYKVLHRVPLSLTTAIESVRGNTRLLSTLSVALLYYTRNSNFLSPLISSQSPDSRLLIYEKFLVNLLTMSLV